MKIKIFSIIILLLLIGSLELQGQGVHGGYIRFEVDLARFRASDDWIYMEIYFSIPREELEHRRVENQYKAVFDIGVNLFKGDSLVGEKVWESVDRVDSLSEIKGGQRIHDQTAFFLKEGSYKLRVRVTDLSRNKGGWYEQNLEISSFSVKSLDVSDIQLSTNIIPDTSKGQFVKNGYRIISNPSRMYGLELPMLYYYCEIYNLSPKEEGRDTTYSVLTVIHDVHGKNVKEFLPKVRIRPGGAVVEVGMLHVTSLISGHYQLSLEILDGGTGDSVFVEKSFFVYRQVDFIEKGQPSITAEKETVDEFTNLEEDELDIQFERCSYIVKKNEKKIYKKLDVEGKRKFMRTFWKDRDSNPLTVLNEYKQEYFQRIALANTSFTTGNREGWKTDQGRILMLYGKPDEIERYPSSIDRKAHQFWHYYGIEGGIYFIFVDVRGFGEMQLVHSTARNELQDYDWERWLQ